MTTYYVAAVPPVAYPALFDLCDGRLPETFEAWRFRENVARRELVAEGHHVIGMCVMPGDLERHCRSRRCRADVAALTALATLRGLEVYGSQADYEAYRASIVVTEDVRAGRPDIVERMDEAPRVRRRPWWAFWRPRYRTVATETMRSDAISAIPRRQSDIPLTALPRRRPWWAFWRPKYAVVDRGVAEIEPVMRRRPWWAFWRPKYEPVAVETVRRETVTTVPRQRDIAA